LETEQKEPRTLTYRFFYRWYAWATAVAWLCCSVGLLVILYRQGWQWSGDGRDEAMSFISMMLFLPALYMWWLHPKITRKVRVHKDYIQVSNADYSWEIAFADIRSIDRPFQSLIRLRMHDGYSWWFSAALERPDYLWEGLYQARPELIGKSEEFESFRLSLVQYDHHEKRKEWFFNHRLLDLVTWMALPVLTISLGHVLQSSHVVINSEWQYFFRLLMYSLFIITTSSFLISMFMKKFVFDKILNEQMKEGSKLRNLDFEQHMVQRSKWAHVALCAVLLATVVSTDINLFSVIRLKADAKKFKLEPGKTVLIDNRYNCIDCAYSLKEGDVIVFGRGALGEVLAVPGEVIAQTRTAGVGRSIASETVMEIPAGMVALKIGAKSNEVILVPIGDLVGKLKKP
jgi:hypothetical protein